MHLLEEFRFICEWSFLTNIKCYSLIFKKSLVKLWICRNPEQRRMLKLIWLCVCFWCSSHVAVTFDQSEVEGLKSGHSGWSDLSAHPLGEPLPPVCCHWMSSWSPSQLDFSCGRTLDDCFAAHFMAVKYDCESVQRKVRLTRVQHQGVW